MSTPDVMGVSPNDIMPTMETAVQPGGEVIAPNGEKKLDGAKAAEIAGIISRLKSVGADTSKLDAILNSGTISDADISTVAAEEQVAVAREAEQIQQTAGNAVLTVAETAAILSTAEKFGYLGEHAQEHGKEGEHSRLTPLEVAGIMKTAEKFGNHTEDAHARENTKPGELSDAEVSKFMSNINTQMDRLGTQGLTRDKDGSIKFPPFDKNPDMEHRSGADLSTFTHYVGAAPALDVNIEQSRNANAGRSVSR